MNFADAFSILYEDNHLLIVNKAAGVLVQGDQTGDIPLVEHCKAYLKEKYDKPGAVFLGVVHRLDRPVSGVVVLARTSKALSRMNKLFSDRETTKTYFAIVQNRPPAGEGTLVNWLIKDEARNKTTSYDTDTPGAMRAELNYRLLRPTDRYWLLQVNPLTGRPHQIRVQLSTVGCPIVGDLKYGAEKASDNPGIYLHARRLEFVHPVKKERVSFTAPFPPYGLWKGMQKSFNE
jgi:23S rRNA pseudouridine1911/1915/1917 synthase